MLRHEERSLRESTEKKQISGTTMGRGDLVIALIKAGVSGDKKGIRVAAEALIAEERAKQHNILADRLGQALNSNNSNTSLFLTGDSTARARDYISEIVPRRSLEDLVLPEQCKTAIFQLIEEQQRASLLRAHSLEPRHRVLLVGPPGNGKTSLAEAVAEAIGLTLFVVRYESMIGSYLGETASRLKRVFDYARTAPCVLFFDEFDAIGKERGDIHETGEIKRVVTSLLMQVDELPSYTIIIAATNHSELLDRAVWRRFQLRLYLPTPDEASLARYLDTFFSRFGWSSGYSSRTIARKLGSISYAEAEQFCLDIRRREVLSMGNKQLKVLVSEQLKLWASRVAGHKYIEGAESAGAPPINTSEI
jgi:SpoVK/Ycf46/Vps4 family AAA+-type ATPase